MSPSGVRWSTASFLNVVRDFKHDMLTNTAHAARAATDHIGELSDGYVPLEEGTLQRSKRIEIESVGYGTASWRISYGTPYARYQHEKTSLRHPNGRIAKYLELPFRTEVDRCMSIMGRELRR